jgi:hypothetical protein
MERLAESAVREASELLQISQVQVLTLIGHPTPSTEVVMHGSSQHHPLLPPPVDAAEAREQYLAANEWGNRPLMVERMRTWLTLAATYEDACEALLWAHLDAELGMVINHLPQLMRSKADCEDALHVAAEHPTLGVRARLFEQLVAHVCRGLLGDLLTLARTDVERSLVAVQALELTLPPVLTDNSGTHPDTCVVP